MSRFRSLDRLGLGLLTGAGLLCGLWAAVTLGKIIESRVWPVSVEWRPTEAYNDHNDLYIVGLMVKQRKDCAYIPPPRARDENGLNYVIVSRSPTARQTWPADDRPQRFGPWVVIGGANKVLHFWQEHNCHPLWTITTRLGTYTPGQLEAKP